MYELILTFRNPLSGDRVALPFQFDAETLDEAKWTSAFPFVRGKLDELMASSTPKEPPTW